MWKIDLYVIISISCMMYVNMVFIAACSSFCHFFPFLGVLSFTRRAVGTMGFLLFSFYCLFWKGFPMQAGRRRAGISRSTIYVFSFLTGVIIYLFFSQARPFSIESGRSQLWKCT